MEKEIFILNIFGTLLGSYERDSKCWYRVYIEEKSFRFDANCLHISHSYKRAKVLSVADLLVPFRRLMLNMVHCFEGRPAHFFETEEEANKSKEEFMKNKPN